MTHASDAPEWARELSADEYDEPDDDEGDELRRPVRPARRAPHERTQ